MDKITISAIILIAIAILVYFMLQNSEQMGGDLSISDISVI